MGKMRNLDDLSAVVPSQFTRQTSYKCPVCGKEHNLNECVIIREEVGRKFLNRTYDRQLSTYRTKVYHDNYLVSYYNIRICPHCAKKRRAPYTVVISLIAASIIALMVRNVSMLDEKDFGNIIGQIFLVLFCGGFLGLIILVVSSLIIQQSQTIDIEKAKEYNAIASNDSI